MSNPPTNSSSLFGTSATIVAGCFLAIAAGALLLLGMCAVLLHSNRATSQDATTVSATEPQFDPAVDSLVREMIVRRAVISVSPSELEAEVNPAFWAHCDLDAKRNLVKTLSLYCKGREPRYGGAVTIKSSQGGRKLAGYSSWSGVTIAGEGD